MRDVESCEGHEPRVIAFERHESGILRDKSFDFKVKDMSVVTMGKHFFNVFPNGVAEIVSAEANTGGLIVQTGFIKTSNGSVDLRVGPVGVYPSAIILSGNGAPAAGSESEIALPNPVRVPAGQALWASATTPRGGVAVTLDMLS